MASTGQVIRCKGNTQTAITNMFLFPLLVSGFLKFGNELDEPFFLCEFNSAGLLLLISGIFFFYGLFGYLGNERT